MLFLQFILHHLNIVFAALRGRVKMTGPQAPVMWLWYDWRAAAVAENTATSSTSSNGTGT